MGPKTLVAQSSELFRQPLYEMLNAKHPLVKLADVIDWDEIERSFSAHFQAALRWWLMGFVWNLAEIFCRFSNKACSSWAKKRHKKSLMPFCRIIRISHLML